jgi:hypothetical protein
LIVMMVFAYCGRWIMRSLQNVSFLWMLFGGEKK